MKNIVILYRKYEEYSLFYNISEEKIVRVYHRKSSLASFGYIFLFLICLYIPKLFSSLYENIASIMTNSTLLLLALFLSKFLAYRYLMQYYVLSNPQDFFCSTDELKIKVRIGKKQYNKEIFALSIFLFGTLVTGILFLLNSSLFLFVMTFIGITIGWISILMHPIARVKIMKKLEGVVNS